jgi:hypothetical protein
MKLDSLQVVVGAITYQILPTSTQYAEIPLAAVDQSCQRQVNAYLQNYAQGSGVTRHYQFQKIRCSVE